MKKMLTRFIVGVFGLLILCSHTSANVETSDLEMILDPVPVADEGVAAPSEYPLLLENEIESENWPFVEGELPDTAWAMAREKNDPICTLNGNPIPCDELVERVAKTLQNLPVIGSLFESDGLEGVLKLVLWLVMFAMVVGVVSFVFRVWMLVDIIQHEKENPALWVIVLFFTNVLGALVYYFAIKRSRKPQDPQVITPNTPQNQ